MSIDLDRDLFRHLQQSIIKLGNPELLTLSVLAGKLRAMRHVILTLSMPYRRLFCDWTVGIAKAHGIKRSDLLNCLFQTARN